MGLGAAMHDDTNTFPTAGKEVRAKEPGNDANETVI